MNDLVKLTAREAVARLARRELSPLELIDAAERRTAATDGAVNALPTRCFERARERARRLLGPDAAPPGYLHGLPVAIKDLVDVAGVRTTQGSPIFRDRVPESSDWAVERLEAMGALVVAKSNTPEFGAGAQTFNEVFGTTRNPWDTATTPGGSSGGAAVALATGQVWLADGSDLGGSLRIPASYCGVVGLRPSPGRVAHGPGLVPFDPLAVEGPMARNIGDLALMLDAQAGLDARDPLSFETPSGLFGAAVAAPRKPRRVAFSPDLGLGPVDAEVREICRRAALAFADLGVEVVEAAPDLRDAEPIFDTLRAARFAAVHGPTLERHRDQLKPEIIWNIEKGLALTADDIGRAERARAALCRRTAAFFAGHDLLLCPTVAAPPFDHRIRYLTELGGVKFETYTGWLFLTFAITLTACPALSLPAGFTRAGLPVGLQMVAPPRAEAPLLAAAALLEARLGLAARLPIEPRGA
jgi:amidase